MASASNNRAIPFTNMYYKRTVGTPKSCFVCMKVSGAIGHRVGSRPDEQQETTTCLGSSGAAICNCAIS